LGDVDVERVAEPEVGPGAGQEVDARGAEHGGRERAVQGEVHLVDDEAGRAVRIDQIQPIDPGRVAEIRGLAARVDGGRQGFARGPPAQAVRAPRGATGCSPGNTQRNWRAYCGKKRAAGGPRSSMKPLPSPCATKNPTSA